jgi:hypothetical protein
MKYKVAFDQEQQQYELAHNFLPTADAKKE